MGKRKSIGVLRRLALIMNLVTAQMLWAQSATITQSVHSSKDAPVIGETIHFIAGSGYVQYNVELNALVQDIIEAFWVIDNQRTEIKYTLHDQAAVFDPYILTPNEAGTYAAPSALITYVPSNGAGEAPGNMTVEAKGYSVMSYSIPSSGLKVSPSTVVFEETPMTFLVEQSGGNPEGWEYSFSNVDSSNGNQATATAKMSFNNLAPDVDVKNIAPDGSSLWLNEHQTFGVTVFPNPTLSLSVPARTEYVPGETITLTASTEGGDPSSWNYLWTVNGTAAGNNSQIFNYITENSGNNPVQSIIEITATNAPNGIDAPKVLKKSFSIITYPTPKFTGLSKHPTAVYSDNALNIAFTVTGGNPDGWQYLLKENGVIFRTQAIAPEQEQIINLGVGSITEPYSSLYSIEVSNSYGDQTFSGSEETTIYYYPTPTASLKAPEENSYFSGDEIELSVITSGGDDQAWSYAWTVDGRSIGSNSPTQKVVLSNTGNSMSSVVISCQAENAPNGIEAPASFPLSFTANVFPTPSVESIALPYSAVFSGTEILLEPKTNGGDPSAWTFSWFDNDIQVSSEAILSYSAVNNTLNPEVHTLRLVAKNSVGSGSKEFVQELPVTIWPSLSGNLLVPEINEWFNDRTFDLSWDLKGGSPSARTYSWSIVSPMPVDLGTGSTLHYTTVNTGNEGVQYTIRAEVTDAPAGIDKPAVTVQDFVFTVYPTPQISSLTSSFNTVFNGTTVDLTASVTGGKQSAWSYQWSQNSVEVQGAEALTLSRTLSNTGTGMLTDKFTFTATNTVGGETISLNNEVPVNVWPTPMANMVVPEFDEYFDGDAAAFSISTQGGDPTAWTYQWMVDGGIMSNSASSFNYTFSNTGTTPVSKTITCIATNAPAEISAPQEKTMSYTVTVYPALSIESLALPYSSVFSGTTVPFKAKTSGGRSDGWTYEWFDNGQPIGVNSPDLSYVAQNNESTSAVHKLTVKAVNTIQSGSQELSSDFELTIYPARTAALTVPEINEWFNDRTFDLFWDLRGGSPSARTYSWSIVSPMPVDLGTGSTLHYTTVNTGNEGVQYTIRAEVTDAPAGIDKPAVTVQDFVFTVYPTPQISSLTSSFNTVFNGTTVDLTASVTGGKQSAWSYQWSQNSVEVQGAEALTLSRTLSNTGTGMLTDKFTFTATNTVGGETISLNNEVPVNVWPTPTSAIITPERTEWFSAEEIPLSVDVNGGDPANWNFIWTYKGQTYQGQNYICIPVNDTAEPTLETVSVTVTNTPTDINLPYSTTYEYKFTLYPTPGIHNPQQNGQSIFDGEKIILQITAVGGKPGGWTYHWTRNGETIDNSSDKLEQTLTLSTSSAESYYYEVTATNEFDNVSRSFTQPFNVTVWPSPTAVLNKPERDAWFVEETAALNIEVDGGDGSAWTYQWSVDGEIAENEDGTYDFRPISAPAGGSRRTVKVIVTNSPEGIAAPFTYTDTYTCMVYPRPYISHEEKYDNLAVFGGNSVTMSIQALDGYPEGWSFKWLRNGDIIDGNGTSLTDTPENLGDDLMIYKYEIEAINALYDTSIRFSQEFDVKVWPKPSVEFGNVLLSNVLSGDNITAEVNTTGGDPDRWSYVWYLNGKEVTGEERNIFTTQAINNTDQSILNNISVAVVNSPENIGEPYTKNLSYEYTIWPAPSSTSIIGENITVVSGTDLNIGAEIFGGQEGEWSIVWTLNGMTFNNDLSNYAFKANNDGSNVVTDVYTLSLINRVEGEIRYQASYTYHVNIYPKPVVSTENTDFEAYYGNNVNLSVSGKYGYPDGWKYEWSASLPDQASVIYTVPESDEDDEEFIVTLKVTNSYENEIWLSQDYVFRIHGWSRGEISPGVELESDYNGHITTELSTVQKGGYTNGWSYQWSLNGQYLVEGIPSLVVTETNYGDDAEMFNWELVATNTLNGIVGSSTVIPFSTCLWPVIKAPEGFVISTLDTTCGNTVSLSVIPDKASGGYNDQWVYTWRADGVDLGINGPTIDYTPEITSTEMSMSEISLGLQLTNIGPKGTSWFDQIYPSQTLRVYNRPMTPSQLVRKGNGSTCTLIAMTELTDMQLSAADYKFVFGYTDASGRDIFMPASAERFCRFAATYTIIRQMIFGFILNGITEMEL